MTARGRSGVVRWHRSIGDSRRYEMLRMSAAVPSWIQVESRHFPFDMALRAITKGTRGAASLPRAHARIGLARCAFSEEYGCYTAQLAEPASPTVLRSFPSGASERGLMSDEPYGFNARTRIQRFSPGVKGRESRTVTCSIPLPRSCTTPICVATVVQLPRSLVASTIYVRSSAL
jgi:hypothetical protein